MYTAYKSDVDNSCYYQQHIQLNSHSHEITIIKEEDTSNHPSDEDEMNKTNYNENDIQDQDSDTTKIKPSLRSNAAMIFSLLSAVPGSNTVCYEHHGPQTPSPISKIQTPNFPITMPKFEDHSKNSNTAANEENDQTPAAELSRKTSNELNRLNKKQREILMRTFKPMEADSVKYGLRMLVALFAEHPRYKKIWPQFRAIPDSSLMSAIELRRHASVYMAGLGQIIHSMDNETVLAEQLNRIARAHIKWNIQRYHIEHMLAPVLDEVRIANRGLDTESREAWVTLYDVIANLVEIYRAVNITNTSQNGTRNPNIQRQNTTY